MTSGVASSEFIGRSDGSEGTARLFQLTARLLEQLAAEHVIVIVLEDPRWADESMRRLLVFLFRGWLPAPVSTCPARRSPRRRPASHRPTGWARSD